MEWHCAVPDVRRELTTWRTKVDCCSMRCRVAPRRLSRHNQLPPCTITIHQLFNLNYRGNAPTRRRRTCTPTSARCPAGSPHLAARGRGTWLQEAVASDTHTRKAPPPGRHTEDTACAARAHAADGMTSATHSPPAACPLQTSTLQQAGDQAAQVLGAHSGRQTTIEQTVVHLVDQPPLVDPPPTPRLVAWAGWSAAGRPHPTEKRAGAPTHALPCLPVQQPVADNTPSFTCGTHTLCMVLHVAAAAHSVRSVHLPRMSSSTPCGSAASCTPSGAAAGATGCSG